MQSTIEQERRDELAARVSELARRHNVTVAVAESLTGGNVATALAAAKAASQWFRGSLVAYASEVKHEVLGVPEGRCVSAEAAETMAAGVRKLLRADVAVGVTGAGGPDPQDGSRLARCSSRWTTAANGGFSTCRWRGSQRKLW